MLLYAQKPKAVCITTRSQDFPGSPVVKNPPSNVGDVGSIPGQGTKITHAAGQLRAPGHQRRPRMPQ